MKKILVLIDVQNDFITGSLPNPEAQKAVPNIVKKIEGFDGDAIFYTKDTHFPDYLETKEGQNLPFEHCISTTWGWEIEDTVAHAIVTRANDVHVQKVIKNTFGSTLLPKMIQLFANGEGVEIELVGFCTDICVVSNALILKANFFESADITVDSSCCAGTSPERHEAALEVMRSCQINVK